MIKKSDLREAVRILRESSTFLIAGHVNPDGDCLGCMCALGIALRRIGKSPLLVSTDGVPDLYRFLPGSETILNEIPANRTFDTAIIVDCDRIDRLGSLAPDAESSGRILEIDHHVRSGRGKNAELVDTSAASCGEIIFQLLREADIPIDSEIGECLLTSIITDTGSFRFSNVSPSTLRISADLMESGASIGRIAKGVYETRTLSGIRLLALALSTLTIVDGGRIAYAWVSRDHMADSQAVESESEGIVNYVRSIRGVRAAMLFRETPEGDTKVSLRAVDGVDASKIAQSFGGGGHKAAAGCTIQRPLNEAIDMVVEAVRGWMEF